VQNYQKFYSCRFKFWEDFNFCWLILFQRQLNKIQKLQKLQQKSVDTLNTFSKKILEKLNNRIISQYNKLENWKLVDYQIDIWKKKIINSKQTVVIFENIFYWFWSVILKCIYNFFSSNSNNKNNKKRQQ